MARRILRIVLLLLMAKLAAGLVPAYAFDFENTLSGYAYWPMIALVAITWVYLMLPPAKEAAGTALKKKRWELGGDGEPFPFPLLALAAAAYFLDQRGDELLTVPWMIHLCLVTLLLLIVPYVAASVVGRAKATVTVCATFALMFLLWQGTVIKKNHHPFLDEDQNEPTAYQQASAPNTHQLTAPAKHTQPARSTPVLRSM